MKGHDVIELIGLERATLLDSKSKRLLENESILLDEIKEKEFDVDSVYFNTDEGGNCFPAIFLKKVESFDEPTYKLISEIHRKVWNYKKVLFLYVYSDAEIRIYNCSEKPLIKTQENFNYEKELQNIEIKTYYFSDQKQLEELNKLFSRIAIDTGIVWTWEDAQFIRNKISIQRRVDKYLVTSLVNTADKLEKKGLNKNYIHKIILRSLFLLYLEDRKATEKELYSQIKDGAESYFDILDDSEATYRLFKRLENDFNGNVFTVDEDEKITNEQLQLIKKCFINGYEDSPQTELFENWRLFDFSIIQIELLSEIYENFLSETDNSLKKNSGAYYTPPALVEFILNEKLPIRKTDTNYSIKILDPSCGSGIFLVESFKRLVKRYENHHNKKLTDFNTLKNLLTDNIYGIELHPQAIKVAAFSLYLALVDNLDPKTLWQKKKLPNLINNPKDKSIKEQGKNLFCRDTIDEYKDIEDEEFDLLIGNPPFGTTNLPSTSRNYCDKEGFAKEKVLPFLHKATKFAPNGKIALIFNTKVLTNTGGTYQNFRRWLFNECYVEKVFNFSILRKAKKNFGGQLFGDATGPISIVYYQKEQPKDASDKIMYYAPKTFVKSNVIDGLSIDFTDLKYLPREECQKPDTKIWKIAMWGGMNDWELINRLDNLKQSTVRTFTKKNNIKSGVGFQLLTQKKDKPRYSEVLTRLKYLDANCITQFYTQDRLLKNVSKSIKTPKAIKFYKEFYNVNDVAEIKKLTAFRRLGDIDAFTSPHIIVKKGLEQNSVCASFISKQCSFRDGVYGFYTNEEKINKLYLLLSYFNSKMSTYYLFMTISSYGIEREQIMKNEYLSIPLNLDEKEERSIVDLSNLILDRLQSRSMINHLSAGNELENFILKNINNIDNIIYESFNLNWVDATLIDDTIHYSLDLFHKQDKSVATYPVSQNQTMEYGETITSELNDFLDGQDLYTNVTVYKSNPYTPLIMIKLSFTEKQQNVLKSSEQIDKELRKLDQHLWKEESRNIYFRKKLNYRFGNDIYIIRPNQRRFWSNSMAIEDASELILEILNEN